jgi:hypothetical protein
MPYAFGTRSSRRTIVRSQGSSRNKHRKWLAVASRRAAHISPALAANVRIFLADILTFDGIFGAKFDILKPRRRLTPSASESFTPQSLARSGNQDRRQDVLRLFAIPVRDPVGDDFDVGEALLHTVDEAIGSPIANDDAWRRIQDRHFPLTAKHGAYRLCDLDRPKIMVQTCAACSTVESLLSVMTGTPAFAAFFIEGAKTTLPRAEQDDVGAVVDCRVHEADLNVDFCFAIEQLECRVRLDRQHFLNSFRPGRRNRVRLELDERPSQAFCPPPAHAPTTR